MNSFQNRQGRDLNKRSFIVEDIITDSNGDIKELKGILIRNDDPDVVGTPLDATQFNEIINNMITNKINSNVNDENGTIQTKIKELANSIAEEVANVEIEENVAEPSASIQTKIRTAGLIRANIYTDQKLEEFSEEYVSTVEEIAKQIVEEYTGYIIRNEYLEILAVGDNPSGEISFPINENPTVELLETHPTMFRYEYGWNGNNQFTFAIFPITSPTDLGTCEYTHRLILRSQTTGDLLGKITITVKYHTPPLYPED